MTVGGTEAIGTGISTADDHDMLAAHVDRRAGHISLLNAIGQRQVLHGLEHAGCIPTGDRQLAPRRRSDGDNDRVVLAAQITPGDVGTDVDTRAETDALLRHLIQPSIHVGFLHLEFRDAVTQQPSDAIGTFVHGNRVTGARQLLGRSQPSRP